MPQKFKTEGPSAGLFQRNTVNQPLKYIQQSREPDYEYALLAAHRIDRSSENCPQTNIVFNISPEATRSSSSGPDPALCYPVRINIVPMDSYPPKSYHPKFKLAMMAWSWISLGIAKWKIDYSPHLQELPQGDMEAYGRQWNSLQKTYTHCRSIPTIYNLTAPVNRITGLRKG